MPATHIQTGSRIGETVNPEIQSPVRLLVYEPRWDGHQPEFVTHVVADLEARQEPFLCRFALPSGFSRSHPALAEGIRRLGARAEVRTLEPSPAIGNGFRGLLEEVHAFKPDSLLLFELTPWERALGSTRLSCAVTGVLFIQYPEIEWWRASGWECAQRWARRWVKKWRTSRWLRRQSWRAVFLLNGERACAELNRQFPLTPVFHSLPDPVSFSTVPKQPPMATTTNTGRQTVRFLFPGVLSRRKGADILLRALEQLMPEDVARMEVLCAGRVDEQDRHALQRAVDSIHRRRPDIRLDWQDRFVPEQEFQEALRGADWILMPYRRPEYSSGILARAAQAGVPVIGPEDGLLGRLIREWKLGLTSPIAPCKLARTLKQALDDPFSCDPGKREEFLRRSRPADFARQLLDAALAQSGCA